MSARHRRQRWATAALLGALLSFGAGAGVGTAQAKSFGTLASTSLLGRTINQHAITDKFDETNNLLLDGTATADGAAWDVSAGTFRISSNRVKATGAPAEATIPGFVNVSVGGDIHTSTTSDSFGILTHAEGSGSYASTLLVYNRTARTLTLERLSPTGVATVWRTVTGLSLGDSYLLLKYLNGTYTAYTSGTLRITYTPTTAQRTDLEANTRVGLGSVDDTTVTFDNFMVYPL